MMGHPLLQPVFVTKSPYMLPNEAGIWLRRSLALATSNEEKRLAARMYIWRRGLDTWERWKDSTPG